MSAPPRTLADARAEIVLSELRRNGYLRLGCDREHRWLWQQAGLTLAQRDAAVERLFEQGLARLETGSAGVFVPLVDGGKP